MSWTVKAFINPSAWVVLTDTAPPEKVCEIPDGPGAYQKALLIAAAPQLLEAAKAKLANCEECEDAALMPGEYCSDECIALADAIAKAEGIYEPGTLTSTRTSDLSPQPASIQTPTIVGEYEEQ
jgi:hypothetical protein